MLNAGIQVMFDAYQICRTYFLQSIKKHINKNYTHAIHLIFILKYLTLELKCLVVNFVPVPFCHQYASG